MWNKGENEEQDKSAIDPLSNAGLNNTGPFIYMDFFK